MIFGEANLSREDEIHDDEYMFRHLQAHETH